MRMPWRVIVLALFLPGGFIAGGLCLAVHLRRRWIARDSDRVEALIRANRATPKPGFEKHDEALRVRTEEKRDIAARMHRKAVKVEAGAAAADILRDEFRVVKR